VLDRLALRWIETFKCIEHAFEQCRTGPGHTQGAGTIDRMCRSIKKLRTEDGPATEAEIREAALQFVRKVSGYRVPSQRNAEAFDAAVADVAEASRKLLDAVTPARRA
jgi:hypothetical protein